MLLAYPTGAKKLGPNAQRLALLWAESDLVTVKGW